MYALMMLITHIWCSLTRTSSAPVLDAVFAESFAGPAYAWLPTRMPARVPAPYRMVTGYTTQGDYVQAHTQALFDAACAAVEASYAPVGVAHEMEKYAAMSDLDWAQVADESLTHAKHDGSSWTYAPVQTPVRIQHFVSSTERMRAQRAAYAAQGLTARGTQPLPTCEGTTKNGSPCKRKANTGTTTCTAHAFVSA